MSVSKKRLLVIAGYGSEATQAEVEDMAKEIVALRAVVRAVRKLAPLRLGEHGAALLALDDALGALPTRARPK